MGCSQAGGGGALKPSSTNKPSSEVEEVPKQPEVTPLYPSRWCVTPEQFFAFMRLVHQRFPDTDPTVQEVVDQIVKPATIKQGTGYAQYINPKGIPCEHFVTHAWQAGVKQLEQSISEANPSGGIWIDFLAIPQTLPEAKMAELMGQDAWKSPCAAALSKCSDVIHVRNPMCNLYSRLWCVFELFLAYELDKPVTVVGCGGDVPEDSSQAIGLSATCKKLEDLAALRAALEPRRESISEWLDFAGIQSDPSAPYGA